MMDAAGGELTERIERLTALPMLVLAILYIPLFVAGYLPGVPADVRSSAASAEDVIIALFAIDLVVRVAVAKRRLAYLRAHWLDVMIVVVPFLRPLRLLRVLSLLPVIFRILAGLRRFMGPYHGAWVMLVGLVSVLSSTVLITIAEQDEAGSIQNFGDALWWAFATITTVGYGDVTPRSPEGRAVAVFLMVIGISLFGMLTAGLAAFFVGNRPGETGAGEQQALVEQLQSENAFLRRELERKDQVLLQLSSRLSGMQQ